MSLSDEYLSEIVSCGLDSIEVSFYGIDAESYRETHGVDKFDLVKKNIKKITQLAREKGSGLGTCDKGIPQA